jgi:hypothetical protein
MESAESLIRITACVESSAGYFNPSEAIIDTGATVCLIGSEFAKCLEAKLSQTGKQIHLEHGYGFDGIHDVVSVPVRLHLRDDGWVVFQIKAVVLNGSWDFVLGLDFLSRVHYQIVDHKAHLIRVRLPQDQNKSKPA